MVVWASMEAQRVMNLCRVPGSNSSAIAAARQAVNC